MSSNGVDNEVQVSDEGLWERRKLPMVSGAEPRPQAHFLALFCVTFRIW